MALTRRRLPVINGAGASSRLCRRPETVRVPVTRYTATTRYRSAREHRVLKTCQRSQQRPRLAAIQLKPRAVAASRQSTVPTRAALWPKTGLSIRSSGANSFHSDQYILNTGASTSLEHGGVLFENPKHFRTVRSQRMFEEAKCLSEVSFTVL